MRPLLIARKPATPVLWVALALILLGLAPAVGRADVILGNLGAANGSNRAITGQNQAAYSWTMGSQAYSVSDVVITLGGSPPSTTAFQLQSDAATGPSRPSGSVLATFIDPVFVDDLGAGTNYVFLTPGQVTLAANTTYWLVGLTAGGSANWLRSNPQTDPAGSGATFAAYARSGDSGATWTIDNGERPKFQLNGELSGVPEPSSLLLVGTVASTAAAAGFRRRRNRRRELAVMTARSTSGT